jgi:lipoyl(octanoyl) transferase
MLASFAAPIALSLCASSSWEALPSRTGPRPTVQVHNLWDQRVPYHEALAWQRRLLSERVASLRSGAAPAGDSLLLLQHPPVLTLGTASTLDNVRSDAPPFELVRTERGGEVTYHGPGQLVLYPILDLRAYRQDVHWYMRALEEVAIRTVRSVGLPAGRVEGLTGVWVDRRGGGSGGDGRTGVGEASPAKICAIGVKLSRWVTMHGLALNVETDLRDFEHIVPCGIADRPVTSMQREMERRGDERDRLECSSIRRGAAAAQAAAEPTPSMATVQALLLRHFAEVFDAELVPATAPGVAAPGVIRERSENAPHAHKRQIQQAMPYL